MALTRRNFLGLAAALPLVRAVPQLLLRQPLKIVELVRQNGVVRLVERLR